MSFIDKLKKDLKDILLNIFQLGYEKGYITARSQYQLDISKISNKKEVKLKGYSESLDELDWYDDELTDDELDQGFNYAFSLESLFNEIKESLLFLKDTGIKSRYYKYEIKEDVKEDEPE